MQQSRMRHSLGHLALDRRHIVTKFSIRYKYHRKRLEVSDLIILLIELYPRRWFTVDPLQTGWIPLRWVILSFGCDKLNTADRDIRRIAALKTKDI